MTTQDFLKPDGKDRRFVRVFTSEELGKLQGIFMTIAFHRNVFISPDFYPDAFSSSLERMLNDLYRAFCICDEDYNND